MLLVRWEETTDKFRASWVAWSVKCLPSAPVMIPGSRLSPGLVGRLLLPLPPLPCWCSLQIFRNKEQRNRWQIQCHIVLGLNNFELTLCMVWGRRSDFPSSVCLKVCLLPTEWLWHLVRNLWRFRGLISVWGFGSGLFICMTLVPVRHAVVSQEVWVLQLFSRLCW